MLANVTLQLKYRLLSIYSLIESSYAHIYVTGRKFSYMSVAS